MKIELTKVSKRYNYDWIFRDITYTFETGNSYAVTGPNGSGKSTLLKIFSGQLTPSAGKINFYNAGKQISVDNLYKNLSFSAPYIDLIEEFTLSEILHFHIKFKPAFNTLTVDELIHLAEMQMHAGKQIKAFSSGMKQRAKLMLSILSDMPILLLDEPTTNLDDKSAEWYVQLMQQYSKDRIVIIASNLKRDYEFCTNVIDMMRHK